MKRSNMQRILFLSILFMLGSLLFSAFSKNGMGIVFGADPNSDGQVTRSTTLEGKYNIVLIIDKSGSMNDSDTDHIAQDSAKSFVDMVGGECRIGVVSFSLEAQVVQELTDISTGKEKIKNRIDGISYDIKNTGGTDLGKAVEAAADLLKKAQEPDRKSLMILFTDGYTELADKALAKSEECMKNGKKMANELGAEIYVIGLNRRTPEGKDTINYQGASEIKSIAADTQIDEGVEKSDEDPNELVNYKITYSAEEIGEFYNKIIAKLNGAGPGAWIRVPYENGRFRIDLNGSLIKEVKINLTSDEVIDMSTLEIFDEEGLRVDDTRSDVEISNGKYYVSIRLIRPDAGIWIVGVQEDVEAQLSYLIVTDVEIGMAVYVEGQTAKFKVTVESRDENVKDADLYNSLIVKKIVLIGEDGNEQTLKNLELDTQEYALYTEKELEPGTYWCYANVKNNSFDRKTEEMKLVVQGDNGSGPTNPNDSGKLPSDVNIDSFVNVAGQTAKFTVTVKSNDTSIQDADLYQALKVKKIVLKDDSGNEQTLGDLTYDAGQNALIIEADLQPGRYTYNAIVEADSFKKETGEKSFEIKEKRFPTELVIAAAAIVAVAGGIWLFIYLTDSIPGTFTIIFTSSDEKSQSYTTLPKKGKMFSMYGFLVYWAKNTDPDIVGELWKEIKGSQPICRELKRKKVKIMKTARGKIYILGNRKLNNNMSETVIDCDSRLIPPTESISTIEISFHYQYDPMPDRSIEQEN